MDREHHEGLRHSHHTARTINPPIRWAYLIAFTVQQHGLPTHGAAAVQLPPQRGEWGIQRGLRMEGLHPATSFVVRFSQNDLARCHRNATWMKVLARSFSPECLRNKNDPNLPIPRVAAAAQQPDTQRVVRRSPSLTGSNQLCCRLRPEQRCLLSE